jgi:hypothetical protein
MVTSVSPLDPLSAAVSPAAAKPGVPASGQPTGFYALFDPDPAAHGKVSAPGPGDFTGWAPAEAAPAAQEAAGHAGGPTPPPAQGPHIDPALIALLYQRYTQPEVRTKPEVRTAPAGPEVNHE